MAEKSLASPRYIQNPDVVVYEEDPSGGLLFNPDTDRVRVLNATGLFVWRLCDGSRDLSGLVAAMREAFDAVPEDQTGSQVKEFIDEMVANGFIGVVEDQTT